MNLDHTVSGSVPAQSSSFEQEGREGREASELFLPDLPDLPVPITGIVAVNAEVQP